MTQPNLLLIPSFTELEWGVREQLEEWANVAALDMPGVGDAPVPHTRDLDQMDAAELLSRWREAAAAQALAAVDARGWDRFIVASDSHGTPTAVRVARRRPDSILGLAIGHAALSHSTEGERAPMAGAVWDAMAQLASQGGEAFARYGISQMTRGGTDEAVAQEMVERFPDAQLIATMVTALGEEPEPIGDDLRALGLPLLLAKHEGCLARTDEGFEDIVAAFPEAETVICPEQCSSSPTFAEALKDFSGRLGGS